MRLEKWLTILFADFWGPVSNFGIPIAAIADMSKDPEMYVPSRHTLSSRKSPHSSGRL